METCFYHKTSVLTIKYNTTKQLQSQTSASSSRLLFSPSLITTPCHQSQMLRPIYIGVIANTLLSSPSPSLSFCSLLSLYLLSFLSLSISLSLLSSIPLLSLSISLSLLSISLSLFSTLSLSLSLFLSLSLSLSYLSLSLSSTIIPSMSPRPFPIYILLFHVHLATPLTVFFLFHVHLATPVTILAKPLNDRPSNNCTYMFTQQLKTFVDIVPFLYHEITPLILCKHFLFLTCQTKQHAVLWDGVVVDAGLLFDGGGGVYEK